jgi:hypothetical protein
MKTTRRTTLPSPSLPWIGRADVSDKHSRLIPWGNARRLLVIPDDKNSQNVSKAGERFPRGQFRQFVDAMGYKTDAEKDGRAAVGKMPGVCLPAVGVSPHGRSPHYSEAQGIFQPSPKYREFQTSGLKLTVEDGVNPFDIDIEP